jgi:hypothetical protein
LHRGCQLPHNDGPTKGLRLGLHEYDPTKPTDTIGIMWRRLIRALPSAWSWYFMDMDKDIEVKTIEQAHDEDDMAEIQVLDETALQPTLDWATSAVNGAEVAARLSKRRMKNMAYIDKVEIPVDAKTELGYGCEDELQKQVTDGVVRRVRWNAREMLWEPIFDGDGTKAKVGVEVKKIKKNK